MKENTKIDELVANWRNGGQQNNPAGPLFAAGEFAEADIIMESMTKTRCGTDCTGSVTVSCC